MSAPVILSAAATKGGVGKTTVIARDLCKIPQNPLNSHQDI